MPPSETHEGTSGNRQIAVGAVLLVLGALVAFLLVRGGVDTLASAGYVVLAAGLALVGNGLVLRRKAARRS